MNLSPLPYFLGVIAIFATATVARADVTIYAYEEGGDVIFTYSGSINTAGVVDVGGFSLGRVGPAEGEITFGSGAPAQILDQFAITGPENFGVGTIFVADQFTGDIFGFCWNCERSLVLPDGYVSNSLISGTMVFETASFGSMAIDNVSGPYVWDVTGTSETITLIFSKPPDPNAAIKRTLSRKVKKFTRKMKAAKRKGKTALARRLSKKIRKLKSRIRRL